MVSHSFLKTHSIVAALLVAIGIQQSAQAQIVGYIEPVVIDAQQGSTKSITLSATASANKSSYQVGEPIQFRVRANSNAYVYILANDNQGRTIQIFPNARQTNNMIAANVEHVLPNQHEVTSFISDKVGVEKFTIITSIRALNFQDIFNVTQGHYQVGDTQQILDLLAGQGIIVNDGNHIQTADGMVISHIQVPITANAPVAAPTPSHIAQPSAASSTATGMVMVSTDKPVYNKGETVLISYVGRSYAPSAQIVLASQDARGTVRVLQQSPATGVLQTATLIADPSVYKVLLWEQVGQLHTVPESAATINLNVR